MLPYEVYLKLLWQDVVAWTSTAPYARPLLLKDYTVIHVNVEKVKKVA